MPPSPEGAPDTGIPLVPEYAPLSPEYADPFVGLRKKIPLSSPEQPDPFSSELADPFATRVRNNRIPLVRNLRIRLRREFGTTGSL